ncbi:hypothetical protein FRC00_008754 [Tulasnella sp. 408]|nr:hypothetical protein FRC00_008754 [Tulasnella sp. 408]
MSYIKRSLVKSADLLIDIHYLLPSPLDAQISLISYLNVVNKHLSRCRSISLVTEDSDIASFDELFVGLRTILVPSLESLVVRSSPSQRLNEAIGSELQQLPGMTAFPKLRRLEIDGIPCQISLPGLLLSKVQSLNLIDVTNVETDQLLDVLRNSPHLERLELGRSPLACPSQPASPPIHLSRLMVLHLIFMPVQVSNFLLTTIRAPDCSELFISSHFPEHPDDVVKEHLFTSNTTHFSPVLQKLLTLGQYKDVDIIRLSEQNIQFLLLFNDEEDHSSVDRGFVRLEFELQSVEQIEETVHWLVGHLERDMPKIPIRLFVDGVEQIRLMNLIDSHMRITHLGVRIWRGSDATPSPILVHMAQPTPSDWPLPDLEFLFYDPVDRSGSQNEVLLDMLRRRYGSGSEESDSGRVLPRPLKGMRIGPYQIHGPYLIGEVEKISPQAETSLMESYGGPIW